MDKLEKLKQIENQLSNYIINDDDDKKHFQQLIIKAENLKHEIESEHNKSVQFIRNKFRIIKAILI